jgi:hypothetical protein
MIGEPPRGYARLDDEVQLLPLLIHSELNTGYAPHFDLTPAMSSPKRYPPVDREKRLLVRGEIRVLSYASTVRRR